MTTTTQPGLTNVIPMKTQITGLVRIEGLGEYPCKNFQNLTVKVCRVTLSDEKLLQAFALDENGMFTGELETEKSTTLIARLYLNANEGQAQEKLIAEQGPFCPKNGFVYVEFKYDPSKYGKPLFTSVISSVQPNLGGVKLIDLNIEQRKQLQCIACVGERTLTRLINANRIWNDLQVNQRNCMEKMKLALQRKGSDSAYLEKVLTDIQLLSDEGITESILFALLKNDNSLELHQILTISRLQLQQKIQQAVDDNTIAPINNADKIIDGFMALRNCILFNSNYDNYFYDAKLIYLTSLDLLSKSNLLDKTIEAGSLVGFLGNEDNQNNQQSVTTN